MTNAKKVLALEIWFFVGFPLLGWFLMATLGMFGAFLQMALFVLWCWELFAYSQYRFCRQEELVNVLNTAATMQAPVELVLRAYLKDRPKDGMYRFWVGTLLCFIFPGYYWIHRRRRFDFRVALAVKLLEAGVPLDQALAAVPGIVSRETALAVTVGQFTGRLAHALQHLPGRRLAPLWMETVPRLVYPALVLSMMLGNVSFMTIFVIPKFERMFVDFRLKLPFSTTLLMDSSRFLGQHGGALPLLWWLLALALVNLALFSSRARWHYPVLGPLYRLNVRGQFLQVLGLMLETGKPLPQILNSVIESGLLPGALQQRVEGLADQLEGGEPLADSLVKQGLITAPMSGLIVAAEKAQNLPWALQELGDALMQRCARLSYRVTMAVFPLSIFACSCLIGFVSVAMFAPVTALLRGLSG